MENLAAKTDAELIAELKSNHASEVESTIRCLRRLHEVDQRGIALDRGYGSLYEFACKELRYSKNEAYPRIRAAELFALDPCVEIYLREYKACVTTLMLTQVTFLRESKRRKVAKLPLLSVKERIAVVGKIANESVKDARRVLAECYPDLQKDCEQAKPMKDGRTKITAGFSKEDMAKFERIKDLAAHKNFDREWQKLFVMLADFWLSKNDPAVKKQRAEKPAPQKDAAEKPAPEPFHEEQMEFVVFSKRRNKKAVPAPNHREARERAVYSCQWVSKDGRRCNSTHGLETDHIIPREFGGTNNIDNLRVLCRAHNRHAAGVMGLRQKKRQADGSTEFDQ